MFETDFPHATSLSPGPASESPSPARRHGALARRHARRDRRQGAPAHRHPALPPRAAGPSVIDDDWIATTSTSTRRSWRSDLHETLGRCAPSCPVARSDEHGGYWVVTRLRGRAPRRPGLGDVQLGITASTVPIGTGDGAGHPRSDRSAAAPRVQAADQPLLHAGGVAAVGGRHPRARHPPHRRLRRAGRVRLHGRVRPARSRAWRSSSSRCTRRPRTSSEVNEWATAASLPAPRRRAESLPSWPGGSSSSWRRRREPARGRRRRRGHGRRDRGPADHRRRGRSGRSTC